MASAIIAEAFFCSPRTNLFVVIFMRGAVALLLCFTCLSAGATDTELDLLLVEGRYDDAVNLVDGYPQHGLHKLIDQARYKYLANTPEWNVLVLYKRDSLSHTESQVDGPDFFLSREGSINPIKELEATLAGFFSEHLIAPLSLTPQCRFPARYVWLRSQLDFDAAGLLPQACPKLDEFVTAVNAESLSVIFPAEHPNSPSSMFGHTLLRFDRPNQNRQTRMLAYAVSYAAIVDTENNLLYAFKGVTGNFKGKFAVTPYYMKLREYAQMENRDVWEYTLNLDRKQVEFILLHAYELALTYFDYYFFTENCSYHLLSLVEAALPGSGLSNYSGWVIPVDTLKRLRDRGLVARTSFHPSQSNVIRQRRDRLTDEEQMLALDLFRDGAQTYQVELGGLTNERQAAVLDLAFEYQRHRKIDEAPALEAKVSEAERRLLLARSAIPIRSAELDVQAPTISPDLGHGTSRVTIGAGRVAQESFIDVAYRIAYHDLLDPSGGYSNHAQLEFFHASARYFPATQSTRLDKLTLIDIVSLEPRDDFFRRVSWRINAGWNNLAKGSDPQQLAFTLGGGFGWTFSIRAQGQAYAYTMLDTVFNQHQDLDEGYSLGVGPSIGWLYQAPSGPRTHVGVRYLLPLREEHETTSEMSLRQSFPIEQNSAIAFDFERVSSYGEMVIERWIKLKVYL